MGVRLGSGRLGSGWRARWRAVWVLVVALGTLLLPAGPVLVATRIRLGARSLPDPLPERNRTAPAPQASGAVDPGAAWPGDFPDPFVLQAGPLYYAYGTEAGPVNVQTLVSTDLVHWTWVGDALGPLPAWSAPGAVWAPAVISAGGRYVMYYSTYDVALRRECISVATSRYPVGPFLDLSRSPFLCQAQLGGSLDPAPFVDHTGALWLAWKAQGTTSGVPAELYSQRLAPDGTELVGGPHLLLVPSETWEHHIVEAPSVVYADGTYFLLYSGNDWWTYGYAEGYATCSGPAGPCRKPDPVPLWSSNGRQAGPGSASVFSLGPGDEEVAYHA